MAVFAGLLAGSFLNVAIWRGPVLWGLVGENRRARGDFWGPRSYCPACRTPIRVVDLVPLLGFAIRRGRCRACSAPIPIRYPLVEAAGALAALASIAVYGWSWAALLAFVYLLASIALAAIDHETGFLPDAIALPLIAAGVLANIGNRFVSFEDALIGAAGGYVAFAVVAAAYKALRRKEGLGGGDAKLLAAIGAWSGWYFLPHAVFIAALLALAAVGVKMLAGRKIDPAAPVRFGPALCAAGAIVFLGGDTLWGLYPIDIPMFEAAEPG